MGCTLSLHVWDKKTGMPLDYGLEFGASSLSWPDRLKIAQERGVGLIGWHETETRADSVDGVRCWWTDSPDVLQSLMALVRQEGWGQPDTRIEQVSRHWQSEPDRYRFVFELV